MKLKTKLVALVFALALVLSALWIYVQAVHSVRLNVSLVGITTNTMTFTTMEGTFPVTSATFCVSNIGRSKVVLNGICRYEAMFDTVSSENGINWGAPELAGILAPGQSKSISLTTPWTIHGPWRIAFNISKYGWRHRFYSMDPWKQEFARGFVPEKWLLRIPSETIRSDWIGVPDGKAGLQR